MVPPLPEGSPVIVGGAETWKPYISPSPTPEMDYSKLAVLCLSFVVTRCDTTQQTWDVCQIPRERAHMTKEKLLQLCGTLLQSLYEASSSIPPVGVAKDWHGSHICITLAFHGLLDRHVIRRADFFNRATFVPMTFIPHFPYKCLFHTEVAVFNAGDPPHLQKLWIEHMGTGVRWQKWMSLFCTMSCGVCGGSPPPISPYKGRIGKGRICMYLQL